MGLWWVLGRWAERRAQGLLSEVLAHRALGGVCPSLPVGVGVSRRPCSVSWMLRAHVFCADVGAYSQEGLARQSQLGVPTLPESDHVAACWLGTQANQWSPVCWGPSHSVPLRHFSTQGRNRSVSDIGASPRGTGKPCVSSWPLLTQVHWLQQQRRLSSSLSSDGRDPRAELWWGWAGRGQDWGFIFLSLEYEVTICWGP